MQTAVKSKTQTRNTSRVTRRVAVRPRALRVKAEMDDLNQYTDSKKTKKSLERALKDVQKGRLHTKL